MVKILEAKPVYEKLKKKLKNELKTLPKLCLASLSIGKSYSRDFYLLSQEKLAEELGVNYVKVAIEENTPLKEISNKIAQLNQDKKITAIVVNKPFPAGFCEEAVFSAIDFKKDVEGMNPYNLGMLFAGEPIFISPTVLSILEFLKMAKVNLYGKEVTVIGFSTLIGKPLALLLGRQFATVSITHIATYQKQRLPFYVKNADIVISAVGKPHLIRGGWIKKGAVVIDVGLGKKNAKLVGDIEFQAAKSRAAFITPVPGGVGRLTPIFLFKNLLEAHQRYHG